MSVDEYQTIGFVPGVATAVVGAEFLALIEADPRSDVVRHLWAQAQRGLDVVDLVDDFAGQGLRRLPAFAIVSREGDAFRTIARGEVEVAFHRQHGRGEVLVSGAGVSTWVEHVQTDVSTVVIRLAGDLAEVGAFAITGGLVPASQLVWSVIDQQVVPEPEVEPGVQPGVAVESEDVAAVDAVGPEPDLPPVLDDEPEYEAAAADRPLPLVAELSQPPQPPAPVRAPQLSAAFDAPVPKPELEPESERALEPEPKPESERAPEHEPESERAPEPEPESEPAAAAEVHQREDVPNATIQFSSELLVEGGAHGADDYDHLFGATQFRPVAAAGIQVGEHDDVPEPVEDPVISGIPLTSAPGPQAVPLVDDGDHDGMTISLAQLRQMQADERADGQLASPGSSGVLPSVVASMVHAVECPSGHLNPPSASACRVCGVEIPDQAHVTVPRPALGRFRFSDGTDVVVTRPMLLGRAPKADGAVSGELPVLVSLDSPSKELSGTHLEVRLEAWQVLVVDRHSTNGTSVQLPQREPLRLHPGEAFPIVPGSIVDLAGEVSFVFEVTP